MSALARLTLKCFICAVWLNVLIVYPPEPLMHDGVEKKSSADSRTMPIPVPGHALIREQCTAALCNSYQTTCCDARTASTLANGQLPVQWSQEHAALRTSCASGQGSNVARKDVYCAHRIALLAVRNVREPAQGLEAR